MFSFVPVFTRRAVCLGLALGLPLLLLLALLPTAPKSASASPASPGTPIQVTTTGDNLSPNGDCSLREAVQAANDDQAIDLCPAGSGADTILLPSGVYSLTLTNPPETPDENANQSGDLDIASPITLLGEGADVTVIDGLHNDRVLHVLVTGTLQVDGLALINGQSQAFRHYLKPQSSGGGWDGEPGGGVYNQGVMTMTRCLVQGNRAGDGQYGYFTGWGGPGGGIYNAGVLELRSSALVGNQGGNGHSSWPGSSITSQGGSGGGLYNTGAAHLANVTLSGNATGQGRYGMLVSPANGGSGGGLYNTGGLRLDNITITANSAIKNGGGVYSYSPAQFEFRNTIIADNQLNDCDGDGLVSQGYNLLHNPDGCQWSGDVEIIPLEQPAGLDKLAVGPAVTGDTPTHALQRISPALDAGACADQDGAPILEDQRGMSRPRRLTCDIGAYESDDPYLAANYATGKPGSLFLFSGSSLPAGITLTVQANGLPITDSLAVSTSGELAFQLLAPVDLAPGRYVIIVSAAGDVERAGTRWAGIKPAPTGVDAAFSTLVRLNIDYPFPLRSENGPGPLLHLPPEAGPQWFARLPLVQTAGSGGPVTAIQVDTLQDEILWDGDCSLREAVQAANWDIAIDACIPGSEQDVILIPAGIYTLTLAGEDEDHAYTGDLDIQERTTLQGAGAGQTVIEAGGLDRVVHILGNAQAALSGLTLSGGRAWGAPGSGGAPGGGGILNEGKLAITNCEISENVTADGVGCGGAPPDGCIDALPGAGIYNAGRLWLADSMLHHNHTGRGGSAPYREPYASPSSAGNGGGLYNADWASISATSFYSNTTGNGGWLGFDALWGSPGGHGAGIYNAGELFLDACTLRGNATGHGGLANGEVNDSGGSGGGLYNAGSAQISASTLFANTCGAIGGSGGGIYNRGSLALFNSTLSGNAAGAVGGAGGAIANGGTLWLDSCTLAENYAPGGGGGLSGGGTARNTLFWANTADGSAAQCDTLTSNGYNLLPAASGCLLSGDLSTLVETADALLGPLDEQGVHPLLPGSPAIDSGACSTQFGTLITTDQRGVLRPQGASCDIGAVEDDSR